jgi:cytochrome c553
MKLLAESKRSGVLKVASTYRVGAWPTLIATTASLLVCVASTDAIAATSATGNQSAVPAWAFPVSPPATAKPAPFDRKRQLHIPNSKVTFSEAQLNDLFAAPDWHPDSHAAMPAIVARGRTPNVYACGYCHLPTGQGRPENASLAGLPATYIVQQVADFKSGARRSAWHGSYLPTDYMTHVATYATEAEVESAAEYFSKQQLKARATVIEIARVPRTHVAGWVYVADPGTEPIGVRLLELAPDITRHERRDDEMRYVAYVPAGSISRGESIARTGGRGLTSPCITCHGDQLQGVGLIPPIAGRSPSYILRQLLAFKTGARAGATAMPMRAVVATLKIDNMIDAAAYAASLQP